MKTPTEALRPFNYLEPLSLNDPIRLRQEIENLRHIVGILALDLIPEAFERTMFLKMLGMDNAQSLAALREIRLAHMSDIQAKAKGENQ